MVCGQVVMSGIQSMILLPFVFVSHLDLTGIWTSSFALLLISVVVSLGWMHFSIRAMERKAEGRALDRLPSLPELESIHDPERTVMPRRVEDWRPEDPQFWKDRGRRIARRNLWISIPALVLAFAV